MKPNKFIIEKQVSEFRMDNGLSATEPITLKSLLLKLNILTVFRPLSDNFSGIGLITESTRSQLAEIKVKYSAKCFGYDTALYEPANEGLVIGDFGEKARKLFEQEKISEGHYIELLHKININGTQENEDSTRC